MNQVAAELNFAAARIYRGGHRIGAIVKKALKKVFKGFREKTMAASLAPLVKSKIKARAAVKGLSIAELEKLVANLTDILKSEKHKEKNKAEAAKKARIAKIRALMEESGLKPDDLKGAGRGRKKKKAAARKKAAPKYRLVIDGVEHLWSGRGRPPKVFKDYMDAGNSKESCAM